MNQQDLSSITVYNDLLNVLKEKGYTDAQLAEIFMKLTAQAEMEVVEEIMGKLTPGQLKMLDSLPAGASASDIIEKVGIDGAEVDAIRAEKTAQLIQEMVPSLNE